MISPKYEKEILETKIDKNKQTNIHTKQCTRIIHTHPQLNELS